MQTSNFMFVLSISTLGFIQQQIEEMLFFSLIKNFSNSRLSENNCKISDCFVLYQISTSRVLDYHTNKWYLYCVCIFYSIFFVIDKIHSLFFYLLNIYLHHTYSINISLCIIDYNYVFNDQKLRDGGSRVERHQIIFF